MELGSMANQGRIKQLKDVDRDGVYDQATVFSTIFPFRVGFTLGRMAGGSVQHLTSFSPSIWMAMEWRM